MVRLLVKYCRCQIKADPIGVLPSFPFDAPSIYIAHNHSHTPLSQAITFHWRLGLKLYVSSNYYIVL